MSNGQSEQTTSPLAECARALAQLACVADATVIPAREDPSGRATLEATTDPAIARDEHLPPAVVRCVYNPDAPWGGAIGIADVTKRSPTEGHWRVVIR